MKRPEWLTLTRSNADDISKIKQLCQEVFPVSYHHKWYEEVSSNSKYFTILAKHNSRVIGLLICLSMPYAQCNFDDCPLLDSSVLSISRYSSPSNFYSPIQPEAFVLYLMNIGVTADYRNRGIATLLLSLAVTFFYTGSCIDLDLKSPISYLLVTKDDSINKLFATFPKYSGRRECKAIYLHTQKSNNQAIDFYLSRGFQMHCVVPGFYTINGVEEEAIIFVLYINGGKPPQDISTKFLNALDSNLNMKRLSAFLNFSAFSIKKIVFSALKYSLSAFISIGYVLPRLSSNFFGLSHKNFERNRKLKPQSTSSNGFISNSDEFTDESSSELQYEIDLPLAQHQIENSAPSACDTNNLKDQENLDSDHDYDPNCLECKIDLLNKKCELEIPEANKLEKAAYIFEQEMQEPSSDSSDEEDYNDNEDST